MTAPDEVPAPRRIPARTFDLIVVGLVGLASAIGIVVWIAMTRADTPDIVIAAIAGLAQVVPLLWRRRYPVEVFVIVALALGAYEPLSQPAPPFGVLVATWSLGAYAARRASLLTIAIGGSALVGWVYVHARFIGERTRAADIVSFAPALLATWALGSALGARRGYTASLEERARLLEAQREENARRAVADERARIARELHDVVAHHVGVMVVQAGGARALLDTDPNQARGALRTIESSGRGALNELRRLLGVLRETSETDLAPQPGLADVARLVEQTRNAGLSVDFAVEGEPSTLPPGVELSAYRIVQEALTNVLKHAGDARATVRLRYDGEDVHVEVSDDGAGRVDDTAANQDGLGHGLVGMRERAALFGGDLHAGPRVGGGFTVKARLPIR